MASNSSDQSMTLRPAAVDQPVSFRNSDARSQRKVASQGQGLEIQVPQILQEQSHSQRPAYSRLNGVRYYEDAYQRYGEGLVETDEPAEAIYETSFDIPNMLHTEATETPYIPAQYNMSRPYTTSDGNQLATYSHKPRHSKIAPPSQYALQSPYSHHSHMPPPPRPNAHLPPFSQDSRVPQQYPFQDVDNRGQQFQDVMLTAGPSFSTGMAQYNDHNDHHSLRTQPRAIQYTPVEANDVGEYESSDGDEEEDYDEEDEDGEELFVGRIQPHPAKSNYCATTVGDESRAKGPFTAQGLEEYRRRQKKANELSGLTDNTKKRRRDVGDKEPYTQASLAMAASTGDSSPQSLEDPAENGYFSLIPNVGHSKESSRNLERAIQAPLEMVNNDEITNASLKKRNIERAPGKKSLKKGKGASDPENIEIVNMKDDGKDFVEISQLINAKRVTIGKKPDLTPGAANCRYNRTAPVLYAAYGREFVPISKRNAAGRRTRRRFAHDDGNIVFGRGLEWNPELDEILTDCVKEYESKKWGAVARMFQEATGESVDTYTVAWRYGII